MAFDFQAAVAAANAVVEKAQQSGGGNSNYAYPLIYPQAGSTVVFRPLFNPASGQILRLVNRHEKIACYRTYGQECPICSIMQQVKDVTGQDPFGRTKASRSRGLCFAQFISSTVPIDKGNGKGNIQAGETVLMMFPWSVYSQINAVIQAAAQTPTGMDQAFSHSATGLYLQVSVTTDFKYTTTNVPFMTFPTQMNDDQFMEFLDKMPSLNEQVLPSSITEDVQKQVNEYSDTIYRQYIAPRLTSPSAPTVPTGFSQVPSTTQPSYASQQAQSSSPLTYAPQGYNIGSQVNQTPVTGYNVAPFTGGYVPSATQSQSSSHPACYGQHNDGDPKCICCPCEVECMQNNLR